MSWRPVECSSVTVAGEAVISVLDEWALLEEEGLADGNIRTLIHPTGNTTSMPLSAALCRLIGCCSAVV